ncbi:MAG: extracellular solute-binding protein [Gordonia sp. (in: high G+C Gram-positive bacteria)]
MSHTSRWRRIRCAAPAAAAAILVAAGLAGCSDGGSSSGPSVNLWTWNANSPTQLWSQVEDALAKHGTKVNIAVRVINSTSYKSVLQTALNGGNAPDLFYAGAGQLTQTYAAAGQLASLNGIVDASSISPSALELASYKGKLYGVPDSADTMTVLYNKDVLDKHHLSEPTTWDQWIGEMKTLKAAGVTPMYMMGVQQWMMSLQLDAISASTLPSSYITDVKDKKANYTDPAYVQALTAYQQLAPYLEDDWQAVGSADNEQQTALALGKTAFIIDGSFDIAAIQKINPSIRIGQFLVPSPNGQQPKIDWYPDANFAMNSTITDKATEDAAEQIIKFTATKEFGDIWNKVTGTVSPINGATMPSTNPLAVQAANWFSTVPISPLWGIRSAMDTPGPAGTSTSRKVSPTSKGIYQAQQSIVVPLMEGKLTPQEAAAQVQKAQSWYFAPAN